MERFATVSLVNKTVVFDEIGRPTEQPTTREVMATINSISAAEYARAGEIGLKAELMFSLWQYEYEGEEEVVYNNKHYSVYRTYINNNGKVELYCQRKVSNE